MSKSRWGAAVAVVVGLVVTVPAATAVDGGPPAGLVWVGRAPDAETSTLYRAGPGGTVRRQPLPYSVNAIGCAPDGTVYGLAASHRGERFDDGPHPVRVRPDGTVDDLGPVPAHDQRHPLATGYAAALRAGPGAALTLVVAAGSAVREVRLTPGRPTLTASRPLPGTAFIGDWATDTRGDLVTVTGSAGRATLLRLTAGSLRPSGTALPGLPAGPHYGGAALGPDGTLYVLYHRASARGTIYRVPPPGRGPARAVSTVDPAESTDAAMCPVQRVPSSPPLVPAAVPDTPDTRPAAPRAATPDTPGTRPAGPRAAVRTRVPETGSPPPDRAVPGPRPAGTTRPHRQTTMAAPPPARPITSRLLPVVGAVIVGAVAALCLIRRARVVTARRGRPRGRRRGGR